MPRGKPQSFPEFMERMENYSRPLRIHREDSLHIDHGLFCEECCNKMAQGGDRARYLGKAILPGNAVYPNQMQLLSTNQEFTVHYNQDNSIHHITVNANVKSGRWDGDGKVIQPTI